MIFPWFLLAMGISIPFSRASWARRRILIRAAALVALGWLYTLAFIGCWWLVLFWMYRRRAFLRL